MSLKIVHISSKNEFLALKMYVFRPKIENQGNLSQKTSKNAIFALKNVDFLSKKLQIFQNCPKIVKTSHFLLQKMSIFSCKNWKSRESLKNRPKNAIFGSEKCRFFVKNCQFLKIGVWKLFKNRPKFLNFSKFCLKNVIFLSKKKFENWNFGESLKKWIFGSEKC